MNISRLSKPIVITALSIVAFGVGLVLGRIRLQPPGGTSLAAYKWDKLCTQMHAVYGGRAGATPLCHEAQSLTDLAGLFLVLGAAGIITGIVLGIRRNLRNDHSKQCLVTNPTTEGITQS